ncbi:MAG TPA: hypothetical protein VFP92_10575 [Rhodanobacteraceae bacterium]|nr:hypothetical protein [Rhodanobacteraceae bacterium]
MTDDLSALDNLRPEVAAAIRIMSGEARGNRDDAYDVIEAELLRLAGENASMRHIIETLDVEGHRRADRSEAELAAARETIKRLNRRVQVAEAGIAEKVKASAPGSLGRALANAAADKYMRERDMAQTELAALKARIAEAPVATLVYGQSDMLSVLSAENADDWAGKRVRLVVED